MVVARITTEYMLKIPEEFRPMIEAGQEVSISADAHGRLVVTPVEQIRAHLLESFGLWAGRDDTPRNDVAYVDDIRRRLHTSADVADPIDSYS